MKQSSLLAYALSTKVTSAGYDPNMTRVDFSFKDTKTGIGRRKFW